MKDRAARIGPEALARQWPALLSCLMLKATRDAVSLQRRRVLLSLN
jgi:hypothetical protein